MQDAFPWVDNYWDSGECGLHVHTRACVCLDPGVLEVPASVFPLPAQTWVPILPATRDEDGNGVSPPPFSVILVIEGSIG